MGVGLGNLDSMYEAFFEVCLSFFGYWQEFRSFGIFITRSGRLEIVTN